MIMQESGEMYLETIYVLSQKKENVRSLDVAEFAVGSPMIVRHVTTSISEGHRTAHAHHILTDVKHLSFQFCGHPQVVLVTYGYVPPPALAMALKKFPLIPSLVSLLYMRNAIPLGAFLA